jgi:hypothetical protein
MSGNPVEQIFNIFEEMREEQVTLVNPNPGVPYRHTRGGVSVDIPPLHPFKLTPDEARWALVKALRRHQDAVVQAAAEKLAFARMWDSDSVVKREMALDFGKLVKGRVVTHTQPKPYPGLICLDDEKNKVIYKEILENLDKQPTSVAEDSAEPVFAKKLIPVSEDAAVKANVDFAEDLAALENLSGEITELDEAGPDELDGSTETLGALLTITKPGDVTDETWTPKMYRKYLSDKGIGVNPRENRPQLAKKAMDVFNVEARALEAAGVLFKTE